MAGEFRNRLSKDEADIILKNVPRKVKSYSPLRAKNAVLYKMPRIFLCAARFMAVFPPTASYAPANVRVS